MRPNYNKIADPYYVSKEERYELSQEYNAYDWPKLILGNLAIYWRKLTNQSITKIDHPGMLIGTLTGKATTFWNVAADMHTMLTVPATMVAAIINAAKGKPSTVSFPDSVLFKNNKCNLYKILFTDYKKVDVNNIKSYKYLFTLYKEVIQEIKTRYCPKLADPRTMSSEEISDMKLFRPDKAQKEMDTAIRYYESVSPEFAKLAKDVAAFVTEDILHYIEKNTIMD